MQSYDRCYSSLLDVVWFLHNHNVKGSEHMDKQNLSAGRLSIAVAGIFWGTSGIFAQYLLNAGISTEWISFLRLSIGCLVLIASTARTNTELLRIDGRGLLLAAFLGLVSQAGFNLFYYNAIRLIGVAPSAVLLYTAPFFLLLWSVLFFGERVSLWKLVAVTICFLGCLIAVTEGHLEMLQVSLVGVLLALLAAFSYSLMSAVSKRFMESYAPVTILIYSFFIGAVALLPYAAFCGHFPSHLSFPVVLATLGLGVIPSVLSYSLYLAGIAKGVELSQAGVISTLEMVCSVFLAGLFFNESLGPVRLLGIGLILMAILMMNRSPNPQVRHVEAVEYDDLS